MQVTLLFYKRKPGQPGINKALSLLSIPVTRMYAHASVSSGAWVFTYSRKGYRLIPKAKAPTPDQTIQLQATNHHSLLAWENPKPSRLPLLKAVLAVILPSRFDNCASTAGRVVGIQAGTPDSLYRKATRLQGGKS